MKRTDLFFGLERPDGQVTETEFNTFLENVVVPAFPDGLTVLDADGRWNSPERGLVKERSKVLVLLHDGADELIEKIRATYKKWFQQDSVLRLDYSVNVSF